MTDRRFDRVCELLGEESFRRLRESSVTVVGLGGVGAHTALALARSGVGELTLVDFDLVTETSLNRNPLTEPSDVGRPKAVVLAESLEASCPDTRIRPLQLFFHQDSADGIFSNGSDAAVDAIDSLNPKVALLETCIGRRIPVFSSMGASGRTDPAKVRTGDISETGGCPLARQVRKYLRKRGITTGIRCVWSTEPAGDHALPADGEDLTLLRGRVRNRIPSWIVMPGIFGYALAGLVMDTISEARP